jgi:hypothetical protein
MPGDFATEVRYTERGASWRPLGVVVLLCLIGLLIDALLPGHGVHVLGWVLAFVAIAGVIGIASYARMQFGTVTVTTTSLRVGRETLPLSTVDYSYLVDDEVGGPPVGARVLGGAMAVPKGRLPMPLRLTDGTVVIVPCRDPDALRAALADAPDGLR